MTHGIQSQGRGQGYSQGLCLKYIGENWIVYQGQFFLVKSLNLHILVTSLLYLLASYVFHNNYLY